MLPLPSATQALLLVNVAIFFLDRLVGHALFAPFALWPVDSGAFFPWQLGTYAFLHGSFEHLFFNMLGLWIFGGELETLWGRKRYLLFYGSSVLAAAVVQLIVQELLGSRAPTVGASGGLFGLLLAYGTIFPNRTILLFFVLPVQAKWLVIGYGVLELYQGVFMRGSGVAHFAHLGGMLGGWLVLRYWAGKPPFRSGGRRR